MPKKKSAAAPRKKAAAPKKPAQKTESDPVAQAFALVQLQCYAAKESESVMKRLKEAARQDKLSDDQERAFRLARRAYDAAHRRLVELLEKKCAGLIHEAMKVSSAASKPPKTAQPSSADK